MFNRRTLLCGVAALALLAVVVAAGKPPPPPPPSNPDPAVLYTVNEGGYDTQVWVMNDDGSNQTRLISAATHGIVGHAGGWARDNRKFAFDGWNSGSSPTAPTYWRLYVAELDMANGIRAINVTSIYRNPDRAGHVGGTVWSPDGQWIFFHNWVPDGGPGGNGYDLFAIRPDGSEMVPLMSTPGRSESNPSIDREGRFLVYQTLTDNGSIDRPLYKGMLAWDNGRPVITGETCLTDQGPLAGLTCNGTKIDPDGTRVSTEVHTNAWTAWIIPLENPYQPEPSPTARAGSWLSNSTLVYTVYVAKPRQFYIAKRDLGGGAETILDSMKGSDGSLGGPSPRWPSAP